MPSLRSSAPTFISRQVTEARYFYLELDPAPGSELVVVCGGCEQCLPGYRVQRDDFRWFSLEYVAGGRGQVEYASGCYDLREGTAFTYGPGVPHEIRTDPANPMVKYFVDFAGTRCLEWLTPLGLAPGSTVRVSTPRRIMEIFESALQNGSKGTAYSAQISAAILDLLTLKIAENRTVDEGRHMRAFSTYTRCRLYIESHYRIVQTLDDISRGCHVDRAYLCRLFKRFDDQRPYQLLMRLKMNRATELLLQEDMMVKEVADDLGFADPYHFSRAFKRFIGVSPSRFVELGHRGSVRRARTEPLAERPYTPGAV